MLYLLSRKGRSPTGLCSFLLLLVYPPNSVGHPGNPSLLVRTQREVSLTAGRYWLHPSVPTQACQQPAQTPQGPEEAHRLPGRAPDCPWGRQTQARSASRGTGRGHACLAHGWPVVWGALLSPSLLLPSCAPAPAHLLPTAYLWAHQCPRSQDGDRDTNEGEGENEGSGWAAPPAETQPLPHRNNGMFSCPLWHWAGGSGVAPPSQGPGDRAPGPSSAGQRHSCVQERRSAEATPHTPWWPQSGPAMGHGVRARSTERLEIVQPGPK